MLSAIALCIGTAETIYHTSAQSILSQMVPRDQLSQVNGQLYAAELTANQFSGHRWAVCWWRVGATVAFVTPVALWAAAVGALLLVRGPFRIARAVPIMPAALILAASASAVLPRADSRTAAA